MSEACREALICHELLHVRRRDWAFILVEEIIRPLHGLLGSIVEETIGRPVSEETVRFCCASIISQCLYYYNSRSVLSRLFRRDMCNLDEVDGIADHIARFSLNGLKHYLEDRPDK